jgi:hypothetical protein
MAGKMGPERIALPAMKSALVPFRPADNVTPALSGASQIDDPIETTYVRMLREEAEMDISFNITVSVANWALLAGYLVIPGTFTSLQTSNQVERVLQANEAGRTVLHTIQNPPLLGIACLLLVGGIGALMWLLHFPKIRGNYIWLINRLFT